MLDDPCYSGSAPPVVAEPEQNKYYAVAFNIYPPHHSQSRIDSLSAMSIIIATSTCYCFPQESDRCQASLEEQYQTNDEGVLMPSEGLGWSSTGDWSKYYDEEYDVDYYYNCR